MADKLLTEIIVAVTTVPPVVLVLMNDNVDEAANEFESLVGHYV